MITPWFIFTIFMLTLGPIKTVPAFFAMTEDQPPAAARVLALKGAAAAARRFPRDRSSDDRGGRVVASLARRFAPRGRHSVVRRRARHHRTVQPARIAAAAGRPGSTPTGCHAVGHSDHRHPWGVTAILFFADLAFGEATMLAMVVGILLLLLNLLGMLLARYIIAHVGMASFQVLGWIFAVLQAGLAVDAVVTSLHNLALFA